MGHSVFLTYLLGHNDVTGGTYGYAETISFGFSSAIHCNYIEKLETDNISDKTISVKMPDADYFPFMRSNFEIDTIHDGQGWSASKLFILVQIVSGTGDDIEPSSNAWKIIDVTKQLDGFANFQNQAIQKGAFNDDSFILIKQSEIENAPLYNLDYLTYPTSNASIFQKMGFGEEVFFYGNVETDIQATAYTTDIPLVLPLNQFNSTTNPTWDETSSVLISEVGLYDDNSNLVAVGKLNNPIEKNSSIYRTIQFSLDF